MLNDPPRLPIKDATCRATTMQRCSSMQKNWVMFHPDRDYILSASSGLQTDCKTKRKVKDIIINIESVHSALQDFGCAECDFACKAAEGYRRDGEEGSVSSGFAVVGLAASGRL